MVWPLTYICTVNRDKTPLKQILSAAAKRIISAATHEKQRDDAREPPFMTPSIKPEDYSQVQCPLPRGFLSSSFISHQWCSACNDFGGTMLLCAGCRVTACCGGDNDSTGCLEFDSAFEDNDFVYYCQYCNVKGNWSTIEVRVTASQMLCYPFPIASITDQRAQQSLAPHERRSLSV